MKRIAMVAAVIWIAAVPVLAAQEDDPVEVVATVETAPVPNKGDAADDPAIWIHPTDPAQSVVIGTDKKGGLAVYDLAGNQLQYVPDGELNNVDLRYNFPLGDERIALVTATNREDGTIAAYRVDPATRTLENVAAQPIITQSEAYGLCMYHSPTTGKYYVFTTAKGGGVLQWELFDTASGKVDAQAVRALQVGSTSEGCVADDELAYLYVGEEKIGIWKFGAEPDDNAEPILVDSVVPAGRLVVDVEGLAVYYTGVGTGYLIVSSQGSNEFLIYEREGDNAYVATFKIVAAEGIDAVTHTDGIDVTNFALGEAFPEGVFAVQDDKNTDPNANQDFKLVPWTSIASVMNLTIDTSWDPRLVGLPE